MSDIAKKDKNGDAMAIYKTLATHPIVEESIIRLIRKQRFFASLIQQMDRKVFTGEGSPVPTAAVSVTDKVNLFVNLEFFENPLKNMAEAIYVTETGDMSKMKADHAEQIKVIEKKIADKFGDEVPEEVTAQLEEMKNVDWDERLQKMREQIAISKFTAKEKQEIQNPSQTLIEDVRDAVLVHECLHVIAYHMSRASKVDKSIGDGQQFNHQALNIAMDCAINQLAGIDKAMRYFGGITLDSFKNMIGTQDVKPLQNWEYYFELMKQNQDKLKQKYGENGEKMPSEGDDHSQWGEGEGQSEEYTKEIVKGAVRKAKDQANGAGNVGGDVALLLDKLMTSKVNWKALLRKFMNKSTKFTYKPTRAKRNRRRGVMDNVLIKAGFKKEYHGHIAIAVDTSGSMSDEDIRRCFSEIKKINDTTNNRLTVIEADSNITQIYDFDPKKKIQIKGRGGTAYGPALEKAVEIGATAVIYCGDMDAFDTPKDPKIPVLWAVIGSKQSPPAKFGDAIYIDTVSGEQG